MTLTNYMNSKASLSRVDHFLDYEEKNDEGINKNDLSMEIGEINLQNCKFNWETEVTKNHFESGKELYRKNPTK